MRLAQAVLAVGGIEEGLGVDGHPQWPAQERPQLRAHLLANATHLRLRDALVGVLGSRQGIDLRVC